MTQATTTLYQPLFDEAQLQTPAPTLEAIKHLKTVVAEFGTATLITRRRAGGLHGRPMAVAGVDDDLTIWLITSVDSPKVREIKEDGRSMLVFQSSTRFASLNGHVELVHDTKKVNELWKEAYRAWYDSKTDPDIVLLRFTPFDAEYWDNSGTRGIAYVFEALRAYVTGKTLDTGELATDPDVHAKVDIAHAELRGTAF